MPPFSFLQAQYAQVFQLKPALSCKLFAGLGSTTKSATSLPFSSYLILALSLPLCPLLHLSFHLNLYGRSGRNCLFSPPVLSGYNRSQDTRFFRGTTRLISWPERELLVPSVIPCSLSPLIFRICFSFFSGWRRTVSSKFFDTYVSLISTEELVLLCHARCVFSRLRCNGHSIKLLSL